MQKLEFETQIGAPRSRVRRALSDPGHFRRWAGEFAPGSPIAGRCGLGAQVRFLTPAGCGLITRVRALEKDRQRMFEFVGAVAEGNAEFGAAEALAWRGRARVAPAGRDRRRMPPHGPGGRARGQARDGHRPG